MRPLFRCRDSPCLSPPLCRGFDSCGFRGSLPPPILLLCSSWLCCGSTLTIVGGRWAWGRACRINTDTTESSSPDVRYAISIPPLPFACHLLLACTLVDWWWWWCVWSCSANAHAHLDAIHCGHRGGGHDRGRSLPGTVIHTRPPAMVVRGAHSWRAIGVVRACTALCQRVVVYLRIHQFLSAESSDSCTSQQHGPR